MSHNLAPNHDAAWLTPAQVVERLIGPPEVSGPAIGYGQKAAYHWRHARKGRDAGDLSSPVVMRALLAHSDTHGLGLTAEHLIRGAAEDEVAAILAGRDAPVPQFTSRRRPPRMEAAE